MKLSNEREDEIRDEDIGSAKAFQTYLHVDKDFYYRVSTCFRQSSCDYCPSWFYETFIYKYDNSTKEEIWIGDGTGKDHFTVVKKVLDGSFFKDEEEED